MTMQESVQVGKESGGDISEPFLTRTRSRRQYSLAYKRQAVETYASLLVPGEKGAYLRKEGITSQMIAGWRKSIHSGKMDQIETRRTSKKSDDLARLEKKIANLEDLNKRYKKALRIQGKALELLGGLATKSNDT